MFCFGGCNLFCVCVLQLICARGRFPLRNAALSSSIAGLLLQPLSQQGEPDAGLGSPDKEKRIQHGWKGESVGLESGVRMGQMCSNTHTHTQNDPCMFCTHAVTHELTHTQIITIITLAHAQAIIYSNIQLHMQEGTPGQDLCVAQLLNHIQAYTQRQIYICKQTNKSNCFYSGLLLKVASDFHLKVSWT